MAVFSVMSGFLNANMTGTPNLSVTWQGIKQIMNLMICHHTCHFCFERSLQNKSHKVPSQAVISLIHLAGALGLLSGPKAVKNYSITINSHSFSVYGLITSSGYS